MNLRNHLCTWLGLALAAQLSACATDGTDPIVALVQVSFHPSPGQLTPDALETLEFYAQTESGEALEAQFLVDDVPVQQTERFQWVAVDLGSTRIAAVVILDGVEHRADWTVVVTDDGELPSPPIQAIVVEPGDVPGSIQVDWDAPGSTTYSIVPQDFLVAWSADELTEANVDAASYVVVPWDQGVITQKTRLEELTEGDDYHVVVRTRDRLQRLSDLSPPRQARATGHFDVTGLVRLAQPQVDTVELSGVVLDWNGIKTVSNLDGTFSLPNLADTLTRPIEATEGSGLDYYSIITDPLAPISQYLDLVLFPRDIVTLTINGDATPVPRLDFVLEMTSNPKTGVQVIRRWEEYPVDVYVQPYTFQGTELVDYELAFTRGIDQWNQAVGIEVLRLVNQPPAVGVTSEPRPLSEMGSNIGRTSLVVPSGSLFQNDPEQVLITLRDNLSTQAVADRIITHELGHALLLPHSRDEEHLMHRVAPASSLGIPHRDVAFVVHLTATLQRGARLDWYVVPQ